LARRLDIFNDCWIEFQILNQSSMTGFFEELQRRKVYRVAAAYIIAAGFIIQIGSAVFPAWELPNWAFRLVVVLCSLDFRSH
jgi:hypothetical protein